MDKCIIGVIGAGGISKTHLSVLSAFKDVEIRSICDIAAERAGEAAKLYGIPHTYLSYLEMLRDEKLDAVYVMTSPDASFHAARDALLSGRHVFMEKPMGLNHFQARNLLECSKKQNRVLHVGFNRRFIPLIVEISRRFRELTTLTHIEARYYKNESPVFFGGVASAFICDAIHGVDLLRHLASGDAPVSVRVLKAATLEIVNPGDGFAEAWYSSLQFNNGVSALFRANYCTAGRIQEFELHGKGVSAFISLGFGGSECKGRILRASPPGFASTKADITEFDGPTLAGSDRFEDYYGFRGENRIFLDRVMNQGDKGDPKRTAEDCATMELCETILAAQIS
jgi:predicted dehydrogenase